MNAELKGQTEKKRREVGGVKKACLSSFSFSKEKQKKCWGQTFEHTAGTWSKQITIIEASMFKPEPVLTLFWLQTLSTDGKPPIEHGMVFISASLWLLSDVTVAISSSCSTSCPHTTHTHTRNTHTLHWVIMGLLLWWWWIDHQSRCLCMDDLSRGHATLNDFTMLPSTALGLKTNNFIFPIWELTEKKNSLIRCLEVVRRSGRGNIYHICCNVLNVQGPLRCFKALLMCLSSVLAIYLSIYLCNNPLNLQTTVKQRKV